MSMPITAILAVADLFIGVLPQNESHLRELARLKGQKQRRVILTLAVHAEPRQP